MSLTQNNPDVEVTLCNQLASGLESLRFRKTYIEAGEYEKLGQDFLSVTLKLTEAAGLEKPWALQ